MCCFIFQAYRGQTYSKPLWDMLMGNAKPISANGKEKADEDEEVIQWCVDHSIHSWYCHCETEITRIT